MGTAPSKRAMTLPKRRPATAKHIFCLFSLRHELGRLCMRKQLAHQNTPILFVSPALMVYVLSGTTMAQDERDYYYDPALEGQTINVVLYEGPGTQHMKPYIPTFEEETGITVNLIEIAESNLIEEEVLDFASEA